jgi:hypothetical protein
MSIVEVMLIAASTVAAISGVLDSSGTQLGAAVADYGAMRERSWGSDLRVNKYLSNCGKGSIDSSRLFRKPQTNANSF